MQDSVEFLEFCRKLHNFPRKNLLYYQFLIENKDLILEAKAGKTQMELSELTGISQAKLSTVLSLLEAM